MSRITVVPDSVDCSGTHYKVSYKLALRDHRDHLALQALTVPPVATIPT